MTLDEQLNLLEDKIRKLKVEYDIFLSGASKRPPYDLRNQVELILKRLMDEKKMTQAQRFRYNSLTARYCSYRDLWRRIIQTREEGFDLLNKQKAVSMGSEEKETDRPVPPLPPKEPDSQQAKSLRVQISDPQHQQDRVKELYNFLSSAQTKLGEKNILSFESFNRLVQTKTIELKKKLRCDNVTFSVQVKENQLSFTAKADADPSS